MSQFTFLEPEFPTLYRLSHEAESKALSDPRGACYVARLSLETMMKWICEHDPALRAFYGEKNVRLAELVHCEGFKNITPIAVFYKTHFVKDMGNKAAHNPEPPTQRESKIVIGELFHIDYWFTRTYATHHRPDPQLQFDPAKLQQTSLTITASTVHEIKKLRDDYDKEVQKNRHYEEQLRNTEEKRAQYDKDADKQREQTKHIRKANDAIKDPHNYNEKETRQNLIDFRFQQAGWDDGNMDREVPVEGMPTSSGRGAVDYVLWGDDAKPLAIVEAKKATKDPLKGQQQACLYADCLEKKYHQRPLIFLTNGFKTYFWDDTLYPPHPVVGIFKADELALKIQRRTTRRSLEIAQVNKSIVNRPYQLHAINAIDEAFNEKQRGALLVMPTGTGKTRVAIAAVDQLIQTGWVKRVLFLADRVSLVNQAHGAFKDYLPDIPLTNLREAKAAGKQNLADGRILFSTYPTMMGYLDTDGQNGLIFSPAHFDLIIVDEAHRSIYQRYKSIFLYFDSLLLGLTATPRSDIHRDTYALFGLPQGVPTDCYEFEDAIKDNYLVPPEIHSVTSLFQRNGIYYENLSDEEKEEWDEAEWRNSVDDHIPPEKLNKTIFNQNTVDQVIENLMKYGLRIDNGDKIGKTIIFACNQRHADFIVERFNINYPGFKGKLARAIYSSADYAQTLIREFKRPISDFQIAVSVDMLDTGIDIPEIVNLIFFRPVYSPVKFTQMIGRGTRLCPNLFGPGKDKKRFIVFDYFENFKYFNEHPKEISRKPEPPLREKLFKIRLQILQDLKKQGKTPDIQENIADLLIQEVQTINPRNILVTPYAQTVIDYQNPQKWRDLTQEDYAKLDKEISTLPYDYCDGEQSNLQSREFDLFLYRIELFLLRDDKNSFHEGKQRLQKVARSLQYYLHLPQVKPHATLLEALQHENWWDGITIHKLEDVRCNLRLLVQFIEAKEQPVYCTDFEDTFSSQTIQTPFVPTPGVDKEAFRRKAEAFIKKHKDNISLIRLQRGIPLTPQDLQELEHICNAEGLTGTPDAPEEIKEKGLAHFLRSIAGLDKVSVSEAFRSFLLAHNLNRKQMDFINLLIDNLCKNGFVDPKQFYTQPYTDLNDQGISGLFDQEERRQLIHITRQLNKIVA